MTVLLHRLGRWSVRRRWLVIGSWVVLAAALIGASVVVGGRSSDSTRLPGVESQKAYDVLAATFPAAAAEDAELVFAARSGTLADPANAATVQRAVAEVAAEAHVAGVGAPVLSSDARVAIADVTYDAPASVVDAGALAGLRRAAAHSGAAGVRLELSGGVPSSGEQPKPGGQEAYGLAATLLVLLFAFGSAIAAGLPVATALVGLAAGIGVIGLVSAVVAVPAVSTSLASMIGLGVGIDYALLIVTRHREYLHAGMTVEESAGRALATAGVSVVFAGTTVVVAIGGLAIAGIPFVTAMGLLAGVVVALMVCVSLTLLPALLGCAGLRLAGRVPRHRIRVCGLWERVAARIVRRPLPWLAAALALLGLLAAPTLSLRLGTSDAGSGPTTNTTRRAFDLMTGAFGAGANGPLLIVLDGPGLSGAAADRVEAAVRADADVAVALPAEWSSSHGTALLTVVPRSGPADPATSRLVHRLRAEVLPAALRGRAVRALVGGETASFIDLADHIGARLPVFIAAVIGLSFLLLMTVFRSLVIPLKAALMNVVSIAAAYGVVVAVFQWGWARQLFGVDHTGPVVPFIPMFMFAILFGLSMDYEVFLLSRMREAFLATGDNLFAVVHGLSTTARVITSAALIMISVFGAFVLGADPTLKMAGLGLGVAVLIDATVVRIVLVPAATALLGRANWWLPSWIDRHLPRLDIDGDVSLPAPEYRDGPPALRVRVPVG